MEAASADTDIEIVVDEGGWIRRKSWGTTLAALFACAFSLVYIGLLSLGLHAVSLDEIPERLLIGVIAFGLPIVLPAIAAFRMARAGVRISAEEIVVRGPARTWRVDLRNATRFVPGRQESAFAGELLRCTYGVLLERQEGEAIPVWALRRAQWTNEEGLGEGEQRWQPICDRLNALLADTKDGRLPDRINLLG